MPRIRVPGNIDKVEGVEHDDNALPSQLVFVIVNVLEPQAAESVFVTVTM